MIAMQYRFVLPSDYDMHIIDERIKVKGPALDHFDGLVLKSYLTTRREGGLVPAQENSYAPFYVWRDNDAMNRFLASPGFAALCQAFGRPTIQTWSVLRAQLALDVVAAVYATRQVSPIAPYSDLSKLTSEPVALLPGLLADIHAFDPATWQQVHVQLWGQQAIAGPYIPSPEQAQRLSVGHVSAPQQSHI